MLCTNKAGMRNVAVFFAIVAIALAPTTSMSNPSTCVELLRASPDLSQPNSNVDEELRARLSESLVSLNAIDARLTTICPTGDCLILALGRSPAVVSAYLRARHPGYVYNVPLSKFRPMIEARGARLNEGVADLNDGKINAELSANDIAKLYAHFDKFVPSTSKDIVLIDYSTSGATLVSAYHYLRAYLDNAGRTNKLKIAVMVLPSKKQRVVRGITQALLHLGYFDREKTFSSLVLENPSLSSFMRKNDGTELDLSEYGAFDLTSDESPVQPKQRSIFRQIVEFFASTHAPN